MGTPAGVGSVLRVGWSLLSTERSQGLCLDFCQVQSHVSLYFVCLFGMCFSSVADFIISTRN